MAPPTGPLNLDVEAISGICGSISIAAWVVVFSPQIIENFRRSSADGLSVQFIIIWLLGDVFNILGAVLQGVLPTMLILAIYYTIADVVLLAQCFSYKGFTWKDEVVPPPKKPSNGHAAGEPNERTGLLHADLDERERRGSGWSHLSPAVPLVSENPTTPPPTPTRLQSFLWNLVAVLMVCASGVLGWVFSREYSRSAPSLPAEEGLPTFDVWGQIFGWLCAVLYLGSRLPQLLLNWRRKSTEGVSILFFLFACLGNLTYVLSIFAYDPKCGHRCHPGEASRIYGRYILVNLSWVAGSLGTLLLDLGIFAQFFIYSTDEAESDEEEAVEDDENSINEQRWDQRPLLERTGSGDP
ncbi:Uu.00g000350.m01.CDS01 [Anthostomella pinea]|uniref:Uu.00g000350.m01.CDS01 n=1 Tax=Anthostomella pinea TaxID=933095 RepID=A0AAI8VK52_9PEZI|nr:Uu.00g000350.m01.CDS01 [Anthostomella pinea]